MRLHFKSCLILLMSASAVHGQELEPGAYRVSPKAFNILSIGYAYRAGDVTFEPAAPIEDANASLHNLGVGYVRTFGIFGRSANAGILLPGVSGHVEGLYIGEFRAVERTGLGDPRLRLSVNLVGAPAMGLREFAAYQQKTNLGATLVVAPPLGEYDPERLINLGSNRWSIKPELGLSHATGDWLVEAYLGIWLFTDNTNFYGGRLREQKPITSTQFHVLYTFKPQLWISVNANFYRGGRTTVDGKANLDLQENSRAGITLSVPVGPMQSMRFSYSRGAFTSIGAKFDSIGVAYQHVWAG